MNLDPRQRAMLAEMGVRLLVPAPEAALAEPTDAAAPGQPVWASERPAAPALATGAASLPAFSAASEAAPAPAFETAAGASTAAPLARAAAPSAVPWVQQARSPGLESMDWQALASAVASCQACKLCRSRRNTVFGVGSVQADWLVVGEAPGENEDLQGEPFVGQAGKLLDNMLRAVGRSRAQNVYIANVLKCRPPGNRNPEPEEVAQCEPFLRRQVELLRPRLIVAMGRFAVQSLLQTTEPIGRLRGRAHAYAGVPVVVTYHPAYLLRNLPDKAKAWADLCLAVQLSQTPAPDVL